MIGIGKFELQRSNDRLVPKLRLEASSAFSG